MNADTDDAADFRLVDEEGLDSQGHLGLGQLDHRRAGIGDVMMDGKRAAIGKIGHLHQFLTNVVLHAGTRFWRGRAKPEDLQIEHLVVDLEDREQRMRRQNRIDVDQQAADVLAPVADDVGGNDEFFQQTNLESQDLLVHGDAAQLVEQASQSLVDAIEFDKTEIALGHGQGL